jgi:hypothetical protein
MGKYKNKNVEKACSDTTNFAILDFGLISGSPNKVCVILEKYKLLDIVFV